MRVEATIQGGEWLLSKWLVASGEWLESGKDRSIENRGICGIAGFFEWELRKIPDGSDTAVDAESAEEKADRFGECRDRWARRPAGQAFGEG